MTLMATAELKSLVIPVATESVSKFCKRPQSGVGYCCNKPRDQPPLTERNNMETVTVLKKEPTCAELVDEQWRERQEDLKDPEYEALGFDYVEPHTFNDQPEGYWRWQFSWGGPSDELRGYVNEHAELHRLEYWYLDWGDGASIQVDQDAAAWTQMQEMVPAS